MPPYHVLLTPFELVLPCGRTIVTIKYPGYDELRRELHEGYRDRRRFHPPNQPTENGMVYCIDYPTLPEIVQFEPDHGLPTYVHETILILVDEDKDGCVVFRMHVNMSMNDLDNASEELVLDGCWMSTDYYANVSRNGTG